MVMIAFAVCVGCIALSLLRKDAWPLTRYPMFARRIEAKDVVAIRFRLTRTDGSSDWWRPRSHRYEDGIGDRIRGLGTAEAMWGVAEMLRLLVLDEGDTSQYQAVAVVERSFANGRVEDRQVAVFPVPPFPAPHR